MRVSRSESGVTVEAPAKLNLFLEVLAKRADGFHELETVMTAIDLCDTLHMAPRTDGQLLLETQWAMADRALSAQLGDVPAGPQNIVIRALERLRTYAQSKQGATLQLLKRIPSAAGLGGASSDAAAALVAANIVWDLRLSLDELSRVAAEIGSDVPFFLGPPAAVCRGRGEIIEPLPPMPSMHVVVVRPPVGLSTPEVFKVCQPAVDPLSSQRLVDAWRQGDWARLGSSMVNRLEAAGEKVSPWISRLRSAFAEQGCWGYQMSGSGSSYFGICRSAAHALSVASRLRGGGLGFVVCTRTIGMSNAGEVHAA